MAEIKQLRVNGQTLINVPANPSELLELGVDPTTAETLIAEAQQAEQAAEQKQRARRKIRQQAADPETLLGTTSDTTHLLLYGFTTLIATLHSANALTSLSKLRQATAPFAELSSDFLAKIESGEVKLPFIGKGLENVVAEIEQRATAVAEVFESGFESNDKPDVESGTNPASNQNINPTADPVANQAVSGEG